MTIFPDSPRMKKDAIISIDPLNPLVSVIVLQYNPHTLTRQPMTQAIHGVPGS